MPPTSGAPNWMILRMKAARVFGSTIPRAGKTAARGGSMMARRPPITALDWYHGFGSGFGRGILPVGGTGGFGMAGSLGSVGRPLAAWNKANARLANSMRVEMRLTPALS